MNHSNHKFNSTIFRSISIMSNVYLLVINVSVYAESRNYSKAENLGFFDKYHLVLVMVA